jgi:hypothetical protein
MELLVLVGGLLLLDILAMRFGIDSRILDVRDRHAWWPDLMHDTLHDYARWYPATAGPTPLRIRMAHGLRALAAMIEPHAVVIKEGSQNATIGRAGA